MDRVTAVSPLTVERQSGDSRATVGRQSGDCRADRGRESARQRQSSAKLSSAQLEVEAVLSGGLGDSGWLRISGLSQRGGEVRIAPGPSPIIESAPLPTLIIGGRLIEFIGLVEL